MSTHARSPIPFIALCTILAIFGMPASSWAETKQRSLLPHIVRVDHPTHGTYGNGYVYKKENTEKTTTAYAFFSYDCPERMRQSKEQCAKLTDQKTTVTFPYEKKSYSGTIVGVYCHIINAKKRMQSKCKSGHMRIGIVRFDVRASDHDLPPIIGPEAYDYRGRIPFCTQTKRFTPAKTWGPFAIPFSQSETHVHVCTKKQDWIVTTFSGTPIRVAAKEMEQIKKNIIGYPAYDPLNNIIVGMVLGKDNTHVVSLRNTQRIIKSKPAFAHLLFYDFSCFVKDRCDTTR